jgi:hypothetical protein
MPDWEAAQKIFEIGGVLLGRVIVTVFSPRLPRIPPRFHQQKTTATKPVFPKHPSKTPAKPRNPGSTGASKFFPQK